MRILKRSIAVMLSFMMGITIVAAPGADTVLCEAEVVSESDVIPVTAGEGCKLVNITGKYLSEAKEALERINEIRKEACDEGLESPGGKKLSSSDYVPIKWSSDLEEIARLRAVEAGYYMSHERPNGQICFTLLSSGGVQSWGEVLAWNGNGSMVMGVNQWYEEKEDWVNKTPGAVTGHYTQMIDPGNTYVGLGAFYSEETAFAGTVAGEFSHVGGLDETMYSVSGNTVSQPIEVTGAHITEDDENTETGKNTKPTGTSGKTTETSKFNLNAADQNKNTKAVITVKKGSKKVGSIRVKRKKKVKLTVSVNPAQKVKLKKLSKKQKKLAKVSLKGKNLIIKGKKKGKITIILTCKGAKKKITIHIR